MRSLQVAAAIVLAAACTTQTEPEISDMGTDVATADMGSVFVPEGPYADCAPYSALGPHTVGIRATTYAGHDAQVFYPASAPGAVLDAYDLREWLPPEDAALIGDDIAPLLEYPAYRDVDPKEGRFPVALFSHGFGGYSLQSSLLLATIASWGYVVVAPEHPERNLTRILEIDGVPTEDNAPETLLEVLDALAIDGAALGDHMDMEHVAVFGHSAGGYAAMRVADDPRFSIAIAWASGDIEDAPASTIPSIIMAGSNDRLAQAAVAKRLYDRRAAPKQYVSADGLGHLGFADICLIGRDDGGILKIAQDAGVNVPSILRALASDGCLPQDRPPEEGWPLINAVTIGNLEHSLRDADPVDLAAVTACFGELVAETASE